MTFGLTTRPTLAAAVACGQLHMLPWRASHGRMRDIGAQRQVDLVGRPVLVHGGIQWGESEQREAQARGVDDSARGCVVARATIAGFARATMERVVVLGERPSWAPDDTEALRAIWPGPADQVVLLDRVEPVEPAVAMGTLDGPWVAPSALVGRIKPRHPDAPSCPSCGSPMRWADVGGISDWDCARCSASSPRPSRQQSAPRSLEAAFARAAAEAGIDGWIIADSLPAFGESWITEIRPVVDDPAAPWPAPAFTITRQADIAGQAQALVALIPKLVAWWAATLADLLTKRPAPGLVRPCIECEYPAALLSTTRQTALLEGAGYVDELARPIGHVCSRGGKKGCSPLLDTPVACSTACERAALRRERRDPSTAISPPEADWQRALEQRRLWKAAGDARAVDVRRAILIHLAEGTPLPAFTEGQER